MSASGHAWQAEALSPLGDRIWIVLGGGGLRGLSHIGAWQALAESRVPVAGIVGTSIGALVGACVASGQGWADLVPLAFALERDDIVRLNRRVAWVNGIRAESVFRGDTLRAYIARVLEDRSWEDLRIPLQLNAVDLASGATEWFGAGARTDVSLVDAVYASTALPVLFPPARLGDSYYVDGGAGDAFPVRRAAELGATGIVGIDVGSGSDADAAQVVEQGLISVHERIFSIMSGRRRRETVARWDGPPLVFVRPRLDGHPAFAFDQARYFLEEGYRATRAALSAAPRSAGG